MPEPKPFLGVPEGSVTVLNADGTYRGNWQDHSLYDTNPPLAQPQPPGNYDVNREVTNPKV